VCLNKGRVLSIIRTIIIVSRWSVAIKNNNLFLFCFFNKGKYIYIETSSPRKDDDKAVLIFKGYTGGPACLSFYYHMYGRDVNQLNVKLGGTNVYQKRGSQGNQWKKAEFSINGSGDVRIHYSRYLVYSKNTY